MPFADEKLVEILEEKIGKITSVTAMLEKGMSPEDILEEVLGELGVEFTDKMPTQFLCNCSKERISKALISLGRKELDAIINDGEEINVNCHFCNTDYKFEIEDIKELRKNCR